MKRSAMIVLTLLVALLAVLWLAGLAGAGWSAGPFAPAAGAPTVVSYQGQVTVSGAPYTGAGYFKFAIVDGGGTTTWSNDGTAAGEPAGAVQIPVTNGLFSVLLGDTALPNMGSLPATAFGGTQRYLRVWFSSDGSIFTPLSPDRRIASAPYALQSEEARNADAVDNLDSTAFAAAAHVHDGADITTGTVAEPRIDAALARDAEVMPAVLAADGAGSGLDADLLDGQDSTAFAAAAHTHSGADITTGTVAELRIDAALARDTEVMAIVKALDGAGSGLDADLLDGQDSTAFAGAAHAHDDTYVNEAQPNSITSGMIVNGEVLAVDLHDGAALAEILDDDGVGSGLDAQMLAGREAADFQARVTDSCAAGSAIRLINNVGAVICEEIPEASLSRTQPPTDNSFEIVDQGTEVGFNSSITIGTDGLPLISHYSDDNGDLLATHCNDLDCTTSTTSIIDTDATWYSGGGPTSIAIGGDGLGLISYEYDLSGAKDLKVAHCNDVACTTATTSNVDTYNAVGSYNSIAIGADGFGLIAYYDADSEDLKVAHCENAACSSSSYQAIDTTNDVGSYCSIAMGADGLGLIAYHATSGYDLKVAHCSNVQCSSATITTLDSTGNVGSYSSITVGNDGWGLISYQADGVRLKVAHCNDAECTSATITALDEETGKTLGMHTSITIGADGFGIISHVNTTDDVLRVFHCQGAACTGGQVKELPGAGRAASQPTSITIAPDGLPLITYTGGEFGLEGIGVAHCASPFCVPHWRRR